MRISDQLRIDRFLDEFRTMEQSGEFPQFAIVYLPQDHTSGADENSPTPRAHVADNDLAVGRLVEALSRSRFWGTTAVFVTEDDPQNGWDHVDGHRSTCLVLSPWAKRRAVLHRFYNQTSVLRTMELILGLPPLTQYDAAATPMFASFTNTPDLSSYTLIPPQINLSAKNRIGGVGAEESAKMDWSEYDRIDEDRLNHILWASIKGPNTPMPPPVHRLFPAAPSKRSEERD